MTHPRCPSLPPEERSYSPQSIFWPPLDLFQQPHILLMLDPRAGHSAPQRTHQSPNISGVSKSELATLFSHNTLVVCFWGTLPLAESCLQPSPGPQHSKNLHEPDNRVCTASLELLQRFSWCSTGLMLGNRAFTDSPCYENIILKNPKAGLLIYILNYITISSPVAAGLVLAHSPNTWASPYRSRV